jgi:uncharacterized membrane protein
LQSSNITATATSSWSGHCGKLLTKLATVFGTPCFCGARR